MMIQLAKYVQINKRNLKNDRESNVPKIAIDLLSTAAVVECLNCDQF